MEWLIIAVLTPVAIAVAVWGVLHGGKSEDTDAANNDRGADEGGTDYASASAYFNIRRTGLDGKARK
ncbi:MAG: hypothetical protein V4712_15105 [Pseudomonadota bacterium]